MVPLLDLLARPALACGAGCPIDSGGTLAAAGLGLALTVVAARLFS